MIANSSTGKRFILNVVYKISIFNYFSRKTELKMAKQVIFSYDMRIKVCPNREA